MDAVTERCNAVQSFILHHLADSSTLALPGATINLPSFLTLHGVTILAASVVIAAILLTATRTIPQVPSGFLGLVEALVLFIRDKIAVPYLGDEDGRRLTPFLCTLFFFIIGVNLLGLIPSISAATANLSVTGALAAITAMVMIGGAIHKHGLLTFLGSLVPHGIPIPVAILLFPIELVGLLIKSVALMIRLFANILAGHMVLFFMLGMIVIFGLPALPFLPLAILIYIMELFVAILQAYIFTMLSAVFIGQTMHPQH
jgi:F-type H+-transporting ATPase subunit a